MRIGILTFHNGPNYGGHFQVACMVQAVTRLGHEAEVVHYKNSRHFASQRLRPLVYRNPFKLFHNWQKNRMFKKTLSDLPLSQKNLTTHANEIEWSRYDALIIGSDIVWNRDFPSLGADEIYFGRGVRGFTGRLIAYAPSIGPMPIDYPCPPWMTEALNRFDFIGVRDHSTAAFVATHTGVTPPIVADPTWLVEPVGCDETERLRAVLLYSFPLDRKHRPFADAINRFAKHRGIPVHSFGYYQRHVGSNHPSISVDEWQRLFAHYQYVVNGTFHGTLFSIRENARFCTISHPSVDPKLENALRLTNLSKRLIHSPNEISQILETPIDNQAMNASRITFRKESLALLAEALH